jgi:Na+/H+ antiporter NhaD/arsenite permease-like protein
VFDFKSFGIDYALLLTLFCFFGLADNIKSMFAIFDFHRSEHVFLLSALISQITSNVPAALLIAKFTTHWKALIWGTNVGGFGSLIGSLANLIAYKFYITDTKTNRLAIFTTKFILWNYIAFFIGIGLYFILQTIE